MTADLTAGEARELTDRITGQVSELLPLIREAFERRAWIALGLASWDAYCDSELRGLRLPVAQRQEAVRELVGSGMSRRSAAAVLGVDDKTVRNDLRRAEPPAPTPVVPPTAEKSAVEPPAAEVPTEAPAAEQPAAPPTVLGADGRRRQMPAPPPVKRAQPRLDEDPEERARYASERIAEALVTLWAQWEVDPVRWVAANWRPDAYRLRGLPRVQDVFTPSGLRSIAKSLDVLADDLDQKGATL